MYEWDPDSTYVREPPFFSEVTAEFRPPEDLLDDWGRLRVPVVFPPKRDTLAH